VSESVARVLAIDFLLQDVWYDLLESLAISFVCGFWSFLGFLIECCSWTETYATLLKEK
jgi:hypothetical protein